MEDLCFLTLQNSFKKSCLESLFLNINNIILIEFYCKPKIDYIHVV